MNKKIFCGILIVMFTAVATNVSIPVQSKSVIPSEQKVKRQKVRIEFTTPLSTTEIVDVVKKFNLNPIELYYVQDDIQGGYSISDGESIEVAVEKMLNAHNKFLIRALIHSSKEMNKTTDKTTFKRLSILNNQFVSALDKVKNNEFVIGSIQVNNSQSISKMKKAELVSNVIPVVQKRNMRSDAFNLQNRSNYVVVKSLYHESWAPYAGTSSVNQSYTYQTFYFNNTNDFSSIFYL